MKSQQHLRAADGFLRIAEELMQGSTQEHGLAAIILLWHAAYHYTCAQLLSAGCSVPDRHTAWRDGRGNVMPGHLSMVERHLNPEVAAQYGHLFQTAREARYRPWDAPPSISRLDQARLFRAALDVIRNG